MQWQDLSNAINAAAEERRWRQLGIPHVLAVTATPGGAAGGLTMSLSSLLLLGAPPTDRGARDGTDGWKHGPR